MKSIRFRSWFIGVIAFALVVSAIVAWWWPRRSPQLAFESGVAAAERGDFDEVLGAADDLKGHPDFASHEHLLRGIYCLKTNRPVEALREVGGLKPEGELRELALLTAGEALYRTDRLSDSRRLFFTLVSEHPGHVEGHRWLAAIAYDLGAMSQAIDELEIVARLQPRDYKPFLLKGHIFFDQEKFGDATKAYSHALTSQLPADVKQEIIIALGRSQMQLLEYAAALKSLAQADRTPEALALQAECQSSLGRSEEAWKMIEEAKGRDPEQRDVLRVLGRMELDAGHPELAIASLRKVLDQDPHDHESRHQLSQALRLVGKTADADAESQLATNAIDLKVTLAKLNLDAIRNPNNAEMRDEIANLCEKLGKPQLASTWRKAAAACRQSSPAAKMKLPVTGPPKPL